MTEVLEEVKRESVRNLISNGNRPDGREFDEFREINYETDYIGTAEGSCLLYLGDTQIISAVKTDTGEPYPDSPEEGALITSAELVPTASPEVESGPPTRNEKYIEIARVIDRSIRQSGMIDMKEMCIEKGKLVRMLFIDVHILDDFGNLIDAGTLAAVLALKTAKTRNFKIEDGETVELEERTPLPLGPTPLACSIAKFGDSLLVDPTYEEEVAMDSKIIFGIDEEEHIRAMQKSGSGPWDNDQIQEALELAFKTISDLRDKFRLEEIG